MRIYTTRSYNFLVLRRTHTHTHTHTHTCALDLRSLQITVISTVRVGITRIIPTHYHTHTHRYIYIYTHAHVGHLFAIDRTRVPYIILFNNISPEHAPGARRHRCECCYYYFFSAALSLGKSFFKRYYSCMCVYTYIKYIRTYIIGV